MESLGVSTTFSAWNRSRQRERKKGGEEHVSVFTEHRGWEILARLSLVNATSVGEKGEKGKEGKNREGRGREREDGGIRRGHLVAARCVDALGY